MKKINRNGFTVSIDKNYITVDEVTSGCIYLNKYLLLIDETKTLHLNISNILDCIINEDITDDVSSDVLLEISKQLKVINNKIDKLLIDSL